jgi:hypothetical protein
MLRCGIRTQALPAMPLICDFTRESFRRPTPKHSLLHALWPGRVAHPLTSISIIPIPMFARRALRARPSIPVAALPLPLPLFSSHLVPSVISQHISHPSSLHTSTRARNMVTASNNAPAFAQHDVEQEAHHQSNGTAKVNNWSQPGPAAFDFRSTPSSHNHPLQSNDSPSNPPTLQATSSQPPQPACSPPSPAQPSSTT